MASKVQSVYSRFLALLVVVGQVVNQKLSPAWIFQHKMLDLGKVGTFDSDKGEELNAAFDAVGVKLFKSFWKIDSASSLFSTKAHVMYAAIARGAFKASDFTDDKETQELINALAKMLDKSYQYSKLSDVITATSTRKPGNGEKKTIKID